MTINKNKVCCISDIHLGVHQDSPIWWKISLEFAKWLKNQLNKNDISDILILGDILNNRNEVSVPTLNILPKFFDILKDFNIFILVGNHDCFYNKSSEVHSIGTLGKWSNIKVIDKITTIKAFDKNLVFCPWGTEYDKIPEGDIIFGHFEITSFRMVQNIICERGIEPKDMLKKSPLIVSGHFHITEERKYDDKRILYLGSPYELNWNDFSTPKGIYLLDIKQNTTEFILNESSTKHKKIYVSEIMATGITDKIKQEFKNNIVKFTFDKELPEDIVTKIVDKVSLLKPASITFEYEHGNGNVVELNTTDFSGIDVETSLTEYINALNNIEQKDTVIKYLLAVYNKVKTIQRSQTENE